MMLAYPFTRLLIVEDNEELVKDLVSLLSSKFDDLRACHRADDALEMINIWQPTFILIDFSLPDGDAFLLFEAINKVSPFPLLIVMSALATQENSFHLAQLGVRVYLKKPFNAQQLEDAIDQALAFTPNIDAHVKNSVGIIGIKEMETRIRRTMLREALSQVDDSRRGAARLLKVSRQLIQHIIRNNLT